jgi:hypothetical protein
MVQLVMVLSPWILILFLKIFFDGRIYSYFDIVEKHGYYQPNGDCSQTAIKYVRQVSLLLTCIERVLLII